jgi:hypothetical protein
VFLLDCFADPSDAFLNAGSGIRDGKVQIWDMESGVNILENNSENLVQIFEYKIL